jgi:hypothetical protein
MATLVRTDGDDVAGVVNLPADVNTELAVNSKACCVLSSNSEMPDYTITQQRLNQPFIHNRSLALSYHIVSRTCHNAVSRATNTSQS